MRPCVQYALRPSFAIPPRRLGEPSYFKEGWDLSDGGLFGDKTSIMAGVFESDDCVIFRKSGKKYVVKDCLEQ